MLVDLRTRRFAARRSDTAAPEGRVKNRRSGAHRTSCIPALRSRRTRGVAATLRSPFNFF